MVSTIDDNEKIKTWLKCFGISYGFENALDILYVLYTLIRGP